jgi:hypothetical protein
MIGNLWFFLGLGFRFFWDIGFSGYRLDSLYRSTNRSNVIRQRSPHNSINARFPAFSKYTGLRKNPKAGFVQTPNYLQWHHIIPYFEFSTYNLIN